MDNRACFPPESFRLSARLLASFASRIDSLYHSASEMEWQQYRGRMYNRWNGNSTEGGCTIYGMATVEDEQQMERQKYGGGCTIDGTAEIRREDVH